jgi:hypothetical protein
MAYLQRYKDRHGRQRHYYRHGSYRIALPDPDDIDFLSAYTNAMNHDPRSPKVMAALKADRQDAASVYVISAAQGVKVGVATQPRKRLQELQVGSGERLALVADRVFPTRVEAFAAEKKVHECLAQFRTVGEWFAVSTQTAAETLSAV